METKTEKIIALPGSFYTPHISTLPADAQQLPQERRPINFDRPKTLSLITPKQA